MVVVVGVEDLGVRLEVNLVELLVVVAEVEREGRVEDLPLEVVVVGLVVIVAVGLVVVLGVVAVGLVEDLLDRSKDEKVMGVSLLETDDNLVVKLTADFGRVTGVVVVVDLVDIVVVLGVVVADPIVVFLGVVVHLLRGVSSPSFVAYFLKTLTNTACLSFSLSPSTPSSSPPPTFLPLLFESPDEEANKGTSSSASL